MKNVSNWAVCIYGGDAKHQVKRTTCRWDFNPVEPNYRFLPFEAKFILYIHFVTWGTGIQAFKPEPKVCTFPMEKDRCDWTESCFRGPTGCVSRYAPPTHSPRLKDPVITGRDDQPLNLRYRFHFSPLTFSRNSWKGFRQGVSHLPASYSSWLIINPFSYLNCSLSAH